MSDHTSSTTAHKGELILTDVQVVRLSIAAHKSLENYLYVPNAYELLHEAITTEVEAITRETASAPTNPV